MLVSANEEGLGQLRQRVQSRAKTVQPDIAAIEEISVFSSEDRLQVSSLDDDDFGVQKYKIHLFDHLKDSQNAVVKNYFDESTANESLDITFREFSPHTRFHTVKAKSKLSIQNLANNVAVRSIEEMPTYTPTDYKLATSPVGPIDNLLLPDPTTGVDYPVVAVVDSGICRKLISGS